MEEKWLAGVVTQKHTVRIMQTASGPIIMAVSLKKDSSQVPSLPKGTLVQFTGISRPSGKSFLTAEGCLYYTPKDSFSQLHSYGKIKKKDQVWKAVPVNQIRDNPQISWPLLAYQEKKRAQESASLHEGSSAPSADDAAQAPRTSIFTLGRKPEEQLLEDLHARPDVKAFVRQLEQRGRQCTDAEPEGPPEMIDLNYLSPRESELLLDELAKYYPAPLLRDVKRLRNSSGMNAKNVYRASLLLRYCYHRRRDLYVPIPVEELAHQLHQALPGENYCVPRFLQHCRIANQTSTPLNFLILDQELFLSEQIARCFTRVMNGAMFRGSSGPMNLCGLEAGYDSGHPGAILRALDRDSICIQSLGSLFYAETSNKDSAAQNFRDLFGPRHQFIDRYLAIPIPYHGHLLGTSREMPLSERQMFTGILEVPLLTQKQRTDLVCATAQVGSPSFALTPDAAVSLVQDYAPGSLQQAVGYVDQMRPLVREGQTLEPEDLHEYLDAPVLSEDEQTVSRYYHCRAALPEETQRQLDQLALDLLSEESDISRRKNARDVLRTHLRLAEASLPAAPPDRRQIVEELNRDLIGLEEEKALLVQNLYARQRKAIFFVGPPGCGKTALADALARACGRVLIRIDMSAVNKMLLTGLPSLISRPGTEGLFVHQLAQAGRPAVILLDEIDKASPDTANCLLELFENNHLFSDACVGRVDLSNHLFLLSGNSLKVSRPLLDRCQIIPMKPYTPKAKERLFQRLYARALEAEGLPAAEPAEDVVRAVVRCCSSGGARDLEQAAQMFVQRGMSGLPVPATARETELLLGHISQVPAPITAPGTAYCLGASTDGGGRVTPVQVQPVRGGTGLQLLGMGDQAMQESCSRAVLLAGNLLGRPLPESMVISMDSSEKAGASAGLGVFLALWSGLTGATLEGVAASGEILISGQVLPVGGVTSKLIAAIRNRSVVHTVVLPRSNRDTLPQDLLTEVREAGLQLIFVDSVCEAISAVTGCPAPALPCSWEKVS